MSVKTKKPTYEELESRLRAAEALLLAHRSYGSFIFKFGTHNIKVTKWAGRFAVKYRSQLREEDQPGFDSPVDAVLWAMEAGWFKAVK
jgi:hypothetical protein